LSVGGQGRRAPKDSIFKQRNTQASTIARIVCGPGQADSYFVSPENTEGVARLKARPFDMCARSLANARRLSARHGGVF